MDILQKIKMLTSNVFKTAEYKAMGLTVIHGDIDEVLGTPEEVSIHKALAVDEYVVVEDTIVYIDGEPIVDWKYTFADHAVDKKPFVWHVNLSYHDNKHVFVFNGTIDCVFVLPDGRIPTSPHFDDYSALDKFANYAPGLLEDVKKTTAWAGIDPRAKALYQLTWNNSVVKVPVHLVQEWTGDYQE